MSEITLTNANFEAEVLDAEGPVLVDFWASWCGPCKALGPIVSEFAEKHPEIKVGKVNVDDEQFLAQEYKIMSIPTLIVFKDGNLVKQSMGLVDLAAIEAMFA